MTNPRQVAPSTFDYNGIVRYPKPRESILPITEKWAGMILGILLGSGLLYAQTHPEQGSVTPVESQEAVSEVSPFQWENPVAALQANSTPSKPAQDEAEPGLATLKAHSTVTGLFLLEGKLNGVEIPMLIDTGSTWVTIPGALARQMNLSKGEAVAVRTAAGEVTHYYTEIQKLELGSSVFNRVTALIAPELEGEVVLGMNLLGGFKLEKTENGNSLVMEIIDNTPAELKSVPHFSKPVTECMKSGNRFDDYVLACLQSQI